MGGAATAAAIISSGTKLYNLNKDKKKAEKEMTSLQRQKEIEKRKAMNLLEQDMASRRAKLSRSGVLDSASSLAADKRYYKDSLFDIIAKDYDYQDSEDKIKNKYRDSRDSVFSGTLQEASNKVLK